MTMFQFHWLRRFMRRHTAPMPAEYASVWKKRLSLGYMLIAWNAFGFVVYSVSTGKADWATFHGLPKDPGTPAQQWSKTLGIKEATVYRISGFSVDKYEVKNEFSEDTREVLSSTIIREKRDGTDVIEDSKTNATETF